MKRRAHPLAAPSLFLVLLEAQRAEGLGTLQVRTSGASYSGAVLACSFSGLHLVTIDSPADNNAVVEAKAAAGLGSHGVWISPSSSGYVQNLWSNDFSYDGTSHCLFMASDGSWIDRECGHHFAFVCEAPMPPPPQAPPYPPARAPRPPPPNPPLSPPPTPVYPPPPIPPPSPAPWIVIGFLVAFLLMYRVVGYLRSRRWAKNLVKIDSSDVAVPDRSIEVAAASPAPAGVSA